MTDENLSLADGLRRFEQMQRDSNNKLTEQFMKKESGRTKFESVYFSKPEVRAKFDYFK